MSEGDLREIKEGFNGAQRFNYAAEMETVVFSRKRRLIYGSSQMSPSDGFCMTPLDPNTNLHFLDWPAGTARNGSKVCKNHSLLIICKHLNTV